MNPRDFYLCLPQRAVWSCYLSHSLKQSGFSAPYNASSLQLEKLEEKHKTDCSVSISIAQCFSPHSPDLAGTWDLLALSLPWYFNPGEAPCLVGIRCPGLSHSKTRSAITISETHFHLTVWVPALRAVLFKRLSLSHRSKFLKNSLHGLTKLTPRDSHTSQGMQHLRGQESGPGSSMDHTSPLTPAPNISPATRTDFSFLLKIIFLG